MSLGEVKSRLMQGLENYEQRMSVANETNGSLLDASVEGSSEDNLTMELRMLAEQQRSDQFSSQPSSARRESLTVDLNEVMKEVFEAGPQSLVGMPPSETDQPKQAVPFGQPAEPAEPAEPATNDILSRMNRPLSNTGSFEADQS